MKRALFHRDAGAAARMLIRTAEAARMTRNPEKRYDTIMEALQSVYDIDAAYIALYGEDKTGWTLPWFKTGSGRAFDKGSEERKNRSLWLEVIRQKKAVLVQAKDLQAEGWSSLACLPLEINGDVFGVLVLRNDRAAETFRETDLEALSAVAGILALALAVDRAGAFEHQAESEKKFRQLFNHIVDPTIVFDRKTHRFLDCNKAFLTIYGYTKEEFLKMTPYDLHPPEDRELVHQRISTLNKHTSSRYTHVTKDKRRFPVAIRSEATEYQGQPAFISTIRDITDQVQEAREERERLIGTKKEMEIAKNIQTALLPSLSKFDASGFEISANMTPAEDVGGDYYDVIQAPDNRLWFGIGDVTGHGLVSGLIMMMAQVSINTLIRSIPGISPSDLLIHANEVIRANIREGLKVDHHMTVNFIVEEKEGHYQYAGAHETILIFRAAAGVVEQIPTKGMWLGIVPDISKPTKKYAGKFCLEKNDLLVLYTDGVIELCNNKREQYDIKRLEVFMKKKSTLPTETIKSRLLAELNKFMDHQMDDITFLIMKKR